MQQMLAVLGLTLADAIVTAGSAVVVALLVGLIWLAGFRTRLKLDVATLERLANAEGAALGSALIDPGGREAVASVGGGRVLAARVLGDVIGSRIAPAASARVILGKGRARVGLGDVGFPELTLKIEGEPPVWLKQLARG